MLVQLMLDLEPYLVKFDFKETVKDKVYFNDCHVRDRDSKPVIMIIDDECIFFASNKITHGW